MKTETIKSTELRSGNLLQGNKLSAVNIGLYTDGVIAITAHGIHLIEQGIITGLEPIPLTEKWFPRLSMTKLTNQGYEINIDLPYHGKRRIVASTTSKGWMFYYEVNGSPASVNKYYVHEFQNLYKEITGEELKITNP